MAIVAYLVTAKTSDSPGDGLNDGRYFLEIRVAPENIQADEDDDPVSTVRLRYERLRRASRRPACLSRLAPQPFRRCPALPRQQR